jgi:hypothetical protein
LSSKKRESGSASNTACCRLELPPIFNRERLRLALRTIEVSLMPIEVVHDAAITCDRTRNRRNPA